MKGVNVSSIVHEVIKDNFKPLCLFFLPENFTSTKSTKTHLFDVFVLFILFMRFMLIKNISEEKSHLTFYAFDAHKKHLRKKVACLTFYAFYAHKKHLREKKWLV